MNFNIFNSIILGGVIQGLIFGAVVLCSKKFKHRSVYFLTILIILFSFNNLQYYLVDIDFIDYNELFANYYFPWADFTPILLYFYVVSFLYPEKRIHKRTKWLFSLFVIHLIISTLYKPLIRIEQKSVQLDELVYNLRYYTAYYAELMTSMFSVCVIVILFIKIRN